MAVLERVIQMQQQGQSDIAIADALKQEGISPQEINEALSQSKIKSAIGIEQAQESPPALGAPVPPQQAVEAPVQGGQMQPSIMTQTTPIQQTPPATQAPPMSTAPATSPMQPPQTMPGQQPAQEQYPAQAYGEQPYGEYAAEGEYYPEYQAGTDIETVNEISGQIVEEKTKLLKKQITSFARFQEESQIEISNLNERVTKIEDSLNALQMAIIGKIGEYGKDIQNISKEMHATQDSFSKMLNPLVDSAQALQKITGKDFTEPEKPKPKTKSKKDKSEFEDYLR
jgi:hypothetical protein